MVKRSLFLLELLFWSLNVSFSSWPMAPFLRLSCGELASLCPLPYLSTSQIPVAARRVLKSAPLFPLESS